LAGLAVGAAAAGSPAEAASKHPRLEKAIEVMKDAKKYLEMAPKGFGGHKKRSIEAIDKAVAELQAALDYVD
jgi:hypothetical protein